MGPLIYNWKNRIVKKNKQFISLLSFALCAFLQKLQFTLWLNMTFHFNPRMLKCSEICCNAIYFIADCLLIVKLHDKKKENIHSYFAIYILIWSQICSLIRDKFPVCQAVQNKEIYVLPDVWAVHPIARRELRSISFLLLLLHSLVSFFICCLCSLHTIMSAWSRIQLSHAINTLVPKPTFTVAHPHPPVELTNRAGALLCTFVGTMQKNHRPLL